MSDACIFVQRLRDQSALYKADGIFTTTEGEKQQNIVKNRYKDIVPCAYFALIDGLGLG